MNLTQNKPPQSTQERADAIRQIIIGSIICEYGALLIEGKHELKYRVNLLRNAARSVQSFLLNHPDANAQHRALFSREFLKGEIVLICDLLNAVWGLPEYDLENIINAIKLNTDGTPPPSDGDAIFSDAHAGDNESMVDSGPETVRSEPNY